MLWWGKQIAQEAVERECERCATLADEFRIGAGNADFGRLAAAIRGAP